MYKYNQFIINEKKTIFEAIKKINLNQKKTLLVIDKKNFFLGIITDGDIRRYIIKGKKLSNKVISLIKKNPIIGKYNDSHNELLDKMKLNKIDVLPIIKNKKLFKIIFLNDLLEFDKNLSVIINAGGFGKRLRPLTNNKPKTLVKIGKYEMLTFILSYFEKKITYEINMLLHYMPNKIIKFVKKRKNKDINYNFKIEKKPLGTAGGLSLFREKELKENVILINSDIITGLDFKSLVHFHINKQSDFTIVSSEKKIKIDYGLIDNNENDVISITEKPEISYKISAGIYIFKKKILKYLKKNKKQDIPNFIGELRKKKFKVKVFPTNEYWFDIASKNDLKACKIFLKNKNLL